MNRLLAVRSGAYHSLSSRDGQGIRCRGNPGEHQQQPREGNASRGLCHRFPPCVGLPPLASLVLRAPPQHQGTTVAPHAFDLARRLIHPPADPDGSLAPGENSQVEDRERRYITGVSYSRLVTTMRRFFALPSGVLLSSIGFAFP